MTEQPDREEGSNYVDPQGNRFVAPDRLFASLNDIVEQNRMATNIMIQENREVLYRQLNDTRLANESMVKDQQKATDSMMEKQQKASQSHASAEKISRPKCFTEKIKGAVPAEQFVELYLG
jgi:hypothetical protein